MTANPNEQLKHKVENLINKGFVKEAEDILDKYSSRFEEDQWLITTKSVIHVYKGDLLNAKVLLQNALVKYPFNANILFNLAYINELLQNYQEAYDFYLDANYVLNELEKDAAQSAILNLKKTVDNIIEKQRVAIFCKPGLDNFIDAIVSGLESEYRVKKILVNSTEQIDQGMDWADICWFEWCDELVIYASKKEKDFNKKILCRLHSYEAFTEYIKKVNWPNIDKVIFVAEHIRDYVLEQESSLSKLQTAVIPNGIDISKFSFTDRKKGYNIAYVGYINYKKGPMMLLQAFKAIYDQDSRYKLYIAGQFQDPRYVLYFRQMIDELGLKHNVIFDGWQADVNGWLEDKQYILSSSVLEGMPVGIMEAMAKGIQPLIHNFVGARKIYTAEYIWNTPGDCVSLITKHEYNSTKYRKFIENNYSLEKQLDRIKDLFRNISQINTLDIAKRIFMTNPDNLLNTENYFNHLLRNKEEEEFVNNLESWFMSSNLPITPRFRFFYNNLYRKFSNYNRFKYLTPRPYEKMLQISEELFQNKQSINSYEDTSNREFTKVMIILHGLDFEQSVTQFFIKFLENSRSKQFKYYVCSVLTKAEFNHYEKTIQFFDEHEIEYFIPEKALYEERLEEITFYFDGIRPDVSFFQTFYFAPINILLYPMIKKFSKTLGRVVLQQSEPFLDEKLDFLFYYITDDKTVTGKSIFTTPWPIDTQKINKNFNIREKLDIRVQDKIMISIGREVLFNNKSFWDFVIRVITENPVTYVVFGCTYERYKDWIPEQLIKDKKIFLIDFDPDATGYLKSCDLFLNSFPTGGGLTIAEAYYANVPLISFYERNEYPMSPEEIGYLIPGVFYKDCSIIFPAIGDFRNLYILTQQVIIDPSTIQDKRRLNPQLLEPHVFVEEAEKFLADILARI
ncbi:glycosyltransferase [Paenibacillus silviterrae]|uniref:glycosyltransferase n=1 Tax=Paenibacillus silviterrae TaxID=3242194 RepID=UPI0025435701|nr:glycosyltransferase [Paenibacillus chinjuensis]